MLPDFVIVGAQKSGTSTLAYHLRRHPDIYMPEGEVHFFYKMAKGRYEKGVDWYKRVFEEARNGQVVGEKTPTYSYLPGVEKRIHDLIPNVKLVWILRNPLIGHTRTIGTPPERGGVHELREGSQERR